MDTKNTAEEVEVEVKESNSIDKQPQIKQGDEKKQGGDVKESNHSVKSQKSETKEEKEEVNKEVVQKVPKKYKNLQKQLIEAEEGILDPKMQKASFSNITTSKYSNYNIL